MKKVFPIAALLLLIACQSKEARLKKEISEIREEIKNAETFLESYKSVAGKYYETDPLYDSLIKAKDSLTWEASKRILELKKE